MPVTYNLHTVEGYDISPLYSGENDDMFESLFNTLKLKQRPWKHMESVYKIIKYEKQYLTFDLVKSTGLFRSVIYKDNKILVFAPPKSVAPDKFTTEYPPNECTAEEFVEGTMINLFFDKNLGDGGQWEIATRSSVGAKISYFTTGKAEQQNTFRHMFLEVCTSAGFDFDMLPRDNCYTFVFQHPRNRIVTPFAGKRLYLVAAHKIDNELYNVTEVALDSLRGHLAQASVYFPETYIFETFAELQEKWASQNTDYKQVGVVMRHSSGARSKFRNPNYEMVRRLRGNQPKLQFRYLALRQQEKVRDYLKYYPEASQEFNAFREQIHGFTNQLHTNYVECYIHKAKPLTEFPYQFRTHMFNLHALYIGELRPAKKTISRGAVIGYVNNLPPAKLMFSLNYSMRQQQQDERIVLEQRGEA
jgi:hypothetical protein